MPEIVPIDARNATVEQVETALTVMAMHSGNRRKASAALRDMGYEIPPGTLYSWMTNTYKDRYAAVRADVVPRIREETAESFIALAQEQNEVAVQMTQRLAGEIPDIPLRDLPGSLRNVETSKAINIDKAHILTEGIQERPDLPDIAATLRALKASGVTNIKLEMIEDDQEPAIPSTGEEVKPDQLPA